MPEKFVKYEGEDKQPPGYAPGIGWGTGNRFGHIQIYRWTRRTGSEELEGTDEELRDEILVMLNARAAKDSEFVKKFLTPREAT